MPKIVTQRYLEQDLNPRPTDRKPKCLTVAPLRHHTVVTVVVVFSFIVTVIVILLLVCSSLSSSTLFILFVEKTFNRTWSVPLYILKRIFIMRTAVESLNFLTLWLQHNLE